MASWEQALKLAGWSPKTFNEFFSPSKTLLNKENLIESKKKREKSWYESPLSMKVMDHKETPSPILLSEDRIIDLTTESCIYDRNDKENRKSGSTFISAKILLNTSTNKTEISLDCINDRDELIKLLNLPLPNGWTLFEHQKLAIRQCLSLRRVILAYDMGLGKTIICLIWAKYIYKELINGIVIVIAPCTLLETWKREAIMLGFKFTQLETISQVNNSKENNIIISSWTQISRLNNLKSLQRFEYALICDEAHAMQTYSSQRTIASLELCLNKRCKGVILSTGTPMKNGRPANIYPLLVGIRHPCAADKLSFEVRYCNARKTKYCPWDISGAKNLEELRQKIGPYILRKTKVYSNSI